MGFPDEDLIVDDDAAGDCKAAALVFIISQPRERNVVPVWCSPPRHHWSSGSLPHCPPGTFVSHISRMTKGNLSEDLAFQDGMETILETDRQHKMHRMLPWLSVVWLVRGLPLS